jgi:6-phospho-3-hexuloisomerase
MTAIDYALDALRELEENVGKISPEQTESFVRRILSANKVYVAGAGRSRLMLQAFAMRLMHLGLKAYVVGEIATPAVEPGDLVIMGSGSGETDSLVVMAGKVKKLGADLAVITIYPESRVGVQADLVLQINGKSGKVVTTKTSVQPGGNLFEQSMLILLDCTIINIAEVGGIDTSKFKRHANLE